MSAISSNFKAKLHKFIRSDKIARWAYRLLKIMVFIALFGNFIANERPLVCKIDGQVCFPVLKQYAVDLGMTTWESKFFQKKWREQNYDWVLFPPIPYSYYSIDIKNANYKSPLQKQITPSWKFHHWLGTDGIGRDVFAGMITGTRTALLVGILAMGVAGAIGIFLGLLAGYFGNFGFKITGVKLFFFLIAGVLGIFYSFIVRSYAYQESGFGANIFISLLIFLGIGISCWFIASLIERIAPFFRKEITLPIDAIVLRMIEILNSIPGLLLLLSIVSVFQKKSILNIMVIIGLLSWTGIARFVRAELMKIRQMEYIQAAKALGYSDRRTMWKHALPNALSPVMITLAFGIANAILVEAFLSFIGIGLPSDLVTWGTMLNSTRQATYAWWLAIFPGSAIFITVTLFNLLGEHLESALKEGINN